MFVYIVIIRHDLLHAVCRISVISCINVPLERCACSVLVKIVSVECHHDAFIPTMAYSGGEVDSAVGGAPVTAATLWHDSNNCHCVATLKTSVTCSPQAHMSS